MDFKLRRYKKEFDYSYTLGMAPTVELLKVRPQAALQIFVHPKYMPKDIDIFSLCQQTGIPCVVQERAFARVGAKQNVFVLGVFEKFSVSLQAQNAHVVLVNPSDAGNLGTILRTGIGFGYYDFSIIEPAVDLFDPRVVRASMGAVFHARVAKFEDFTAYQSAYENHHIYAFMLCGATPLKEIATPKKPYSLVFGNEAKGLPDEFAQYGTSVVIAQTQRIDSFNLAIAFGIAAHQFSEV